MIRVIFIIISSICIIYFSFALNFFKSYNNIQINSSLNIEDKAHELAEIYSKNIITIHPYRGSVALEIAMLYRDVDSTSKYIKYLQKTLRDDPNNIRGLLQYSKYLSRVENDLEKAKLFANQAFAQQTEYFESNLVLAEIYYLTGEYDKMRQSLNAAYHPWHTLKIALLERALYHTDYLTYVCDHFNNIRLNNEPSSPETSSRDFYNLFIEYDENHIDYTTVVNDINDDNAKIVDQLTPSSHLCYLRNHLKARMRYKADNIIETTGIDSSLASQIFNILMNFDIRREDVRRRVFIKNISIDKRDSLSRQLQILTDSMVIQLKEIIPHEKLENLPDNYFSWGWCIQCEK